MTFKHAFLLSALAMTLGSCASPAEGFTLDVQLTGVNRTAVETLRLTVTPQMSGTTTPRFTMPEEASFEDGAITLSVDAAGALVITITGAYFQENAVGDADPRFSLELWSDDTTMRMPAPQIRGVVIAGGVDAAAGAAYLPSWPLPLGDVATLTIPCTAGREAMCRP
jgi:hypothetical protein